MMYRHRVCICAEHRPPSRVGHVCRTSKVSVRSNPEGAVPGSADAPIWDRRPFTQWELVPRALRPWDYFSLIPQLDPIPPPSCFSRTETLSKRRAVRMPELTCSPKFLTYLALHDFFTQAAPTSCCSRSPYHPQARPHVLQQRSSEGSKRPHRCKRMSRRKQPNHRNFLRAMVSNLFSVKDAIRD